MTEDQAMSGDGGKKTSNRTASVWYRWRRPSEVPFHRYCDFSPPSENKASSGKQTEERNFLYMRGFPRLLLRYTPIVILSSIGLYLISVEVSTEQVGLTNYLPNLPIFNAIPVLLAGLAWIVLLLVLFRRAKVYPDRKFLSGFFVYSLILFLAIAAVYSLYEVNYIENGINGISASEMGEFGNALFSSGFWLVFLVGGYLVYDMMLRVENLFARLPEKHPRIIEPTDRFESTQPMPEGLEESEKKKWKADRAYRETFLDNFSKSLDSKIKISTPLQAQPYALQTAHVFGVLFTIPFVLTGPLFFEEGSLWLGIASLFTDPTKLIVTVVPTILVFVNVVAFFQFLVVIKYFRQLLVDHSPDNENATGFRLRYRPRHPDGNAGFRDLGRFASRINALLILGGLYLVYRFYVGSFPTMPDAALNSPLMISWAFDSLGPFITYLIGVVVWVYFSFWQLHKSMRRGREQRIRSELKESGELPDEKVDFKSAPLWPMNIKVFFSLILGDLLPLISLFPVFF